VNLGTYSNNTFTVNNFINPKIVSAPSNNNTPRNFTNSYNNRSERGNGNTGSFLRDVFNNNNNRSTTPSNTNSSSNSTRSSSSSSSGSGSAAPVRRF
jgi:hypothetical protein